MAVICPATAGMTLRLLALLANVVAAKGVVHSAPVSRGVTGGKPNRIAYCVVMKASSGGAEALNQLAIAGQGVPGWTVLGIGYRLQQGPFGSHAYPQLASVGRGGTIKASNRASGEVNEGYYVAPPLPCLVPPHASCDPQRGRYDFHLSLEKGDILISEIREPHGVKAETNMRIVVTIAPPI